MYKEQTEIKNKLGIHARPAAEFAALAAKYTSHIEINVLDKREKPIKGGSAKSVVNVMSIGLSLGTKIEIKAEGPDEKDAVKALVFAIESAFDEK